MPSVLQKPSFWFGIIISVVCLAAVFWLIDVRQVLQILRTVDLPMLLLSISLILIYMFLRAVRWCFLLENKTTNMHVFHVQNIGYMLTQLLPLRIGDPARAILIGTAPNITLSRGLSTMVLERVLDLVSVVILFPLTLSLIPQLPLWLSNTLRTSSILALIATLGILVAANFRPFFLAMIRRILDLIPLLDSNKWLHQIEELLAGLVTLTHWRGTLKLIFLTVIIWFPIIGAYQTMMLAVGLQPTYLMAAFVMCVAAFSVAVPSSPGQVGVFHLAVTTAISLLGMDAERAASFAFLYHTVNFTLLVTLGLIGLWRTQSSLSTVVESTRNFARNRSK